MNAADPDCAANDSPRASQKNKSYRKWSLDFGADAFAANLHLLKNTKEVRRRTTLAYAAGFSGPPDKSSIAVVRTKQHVLKSLHNTRELR